MVIVLTANHSKHIDCSTYSRYKFSTNEFSLRTDPIYERKNASLYDGSLEFTEGQMCPFYKCETTRDTTVHFKMFLNIHFPR